MLNEVVWILKKVNWFEGYYYRIDKKIKNISVGIKEFNWMWNFFVLCKLVLKLVERKVKFRKL